MKRRWFVLTAILAMAAVTVFLTNQVTQANVQIEAKRVIEPAVKGVVVPVECAG